MWWFIIKTYALNHFSSANGAKTAALHHYSKSFQGFSAKITQQQAQQVAGISILDSLTVPFNT